MLRLACIGVGDVAQRDYLPELARLSDSFTMTVACGRTEHRVRATAERWGIPRWTTSYADAVAAEDVDVVVNLTPYALHAPFTLAAMEAGKHVYSEKPLAPSAADAA